MLTMNTNETSHTEASLFQILIVDAHRLTRKRFRAMIEESTDMVICGEASNASETLDEISRRQPDLLIMSFYLGASNGLDLTTVVRVLYPDVRIILVSHQDAKAFEDRARRAGADAYIEKGNLFDHGLEAIRSLLIPPDRHV